MNAVMLSIRPQWCELIANGKKTIEVRKNRPKLKTPFKCYIYCTQEKVPGELLLTNKGIVEGRNKGFRDDGDVPIAGMVTGEFVCDNIRCFDVPYPAFQNQLDKNILADSCCTYYMLHRYAYHDALCGWHISALQIYDKPKELSEFKQCHKCPYGPAERCREHEFSCDRAYDLERPPQSWCYVEELT